MKLDFRIVRFILLTTIFFFTQRNNGCKDPGDFKPPEDTLENPPPPPALLAPIDGFVYMTETGDCNKDTPFFLPARTIYTQLHTLPVKFYT